MQSIKISICALTAALLCSAAARAQDTGAAVFSEKCSSCHTIGGGNLVGPDLSKVADWPDRDLSAKVKTMEGMAGDLSEQQVADIVKFLKDPDASKELKAKQEEAKAKASFEQDKVPASAQHGKELFLGSTPFQNGGMSCISCHSVGDGGGALGPDLSTVGQRMSQTALVSACENASFKVMKNAYANHPITHDEARDLAKFFETLNPVQAKPKYQATWLAGTGIALVALATIGFGYRKRNAPVRSKLRRR